MKLQIRLFAGLADLLDTAVLTIDIEQEAIAAGELKQLLATRFPAAAAQLQACFVAKNQSYAPDDESLQAGDELALIPPVSGGQGETPDSAADEPASLCEITFEAIDPAEVAAKVIHPDHGAALAFIGTTREFTHGQRTVLLEYDAYAPMAVKTMEQIGAELDSRWPGARCAITHRLGRVGIAETSVVIAVSTPHRADCYEASRYAIERLKQIVPIWKKEIWEDGSEWKGSQTGPWNPLEAPLLLDEN